MNLKRVTITGADDSTDEMALVNLSRRFPFVEWGILVSKRQEGSYRFPSRAWIDRFTSLAHLHKLHTSAHVCGVWVRKMFTGDLDWMDLPTIIQVCERVQINTHAEQHISTTGLLASLAQEREKEFIFQWDGVNNHLTYAAHAYGYKVSALFDTSGGAGILPKEWPAPAKQFWCGYAGGLGPQNVVQQIGRIRAVCDKPFWIDMERRVRTQDDSALDLQAVTSVLEACAPFADKD